MLMAGEWGYAQVDTDATAKTRALYNNLRLVQRSDKFLFGQEFFNSYRYISGAAHGDENYSDSKAVTGSHPALLGSDFLYYLSKDATERGYHTQAVKWAFQQGCVITFDWHLSGRGTDTYAYSASTASLVNNIVSNQNGDRDWFLGQLDKVIDIINKDLVVGEDTIPIVFRPFHEMNGDWFWWGSRATTAANYKQLYALTADYVKARTRSVLFCWSPNTPLNLDYYPGDAYVDIVGLDAYEVATPGIRTELGKLADHARAHNKVAVLAETGNRTSVGNDAAMYWNNTVLPALLDDPTGKSSQLAWMLTWINSSWSYPYVPYAGSSQAARQSFIDFKNSGHVIFADGLDDMYTITDIAVATEQDFANQAIKVYPVPTDDVVHVVIDNLTHAVTIRLFDARGAVVYQLITQNENTVLHLKGMVRPGIYLLQVTDRRLTVNKKILIN